MKLSDEVITLYKVRLGIIIIGLFGNAISFVVFSRKAFRRNSISFYCRALALYDSVILIVQVCNLIPTLFLDIDIFSASNGLCKLSYYVFSGFSPISGWIIVAFSVDKVTSVLYPTR